MELLLDTHIWLWSLSAPERLRPAVLNALASPSNRLWLSAVNFWEFYLLVARRRFVAEQGADAWLAMVNQPGRFGEVPLTSEIVRVAAGLDSPHRDPADRFLAATALVHAFTLVTADPHLIGLKPVMVLENQ